MKPRTDSTSSQQLDPCLPPGALLTRKTIAALPGLSDSTIARRVRAGSMPQPIRLSSNCIRWRAGDVTRWLRKLAKEGKQ